MSVFSAALEKFIISVVKFLQIAVICPALILKTKGSAPAGRVVKNMKKVLCVILASVMLLCFAACTETGIKETDTAAPVTAEATETEADTEPKITVPE